MLFILSVVFLFFVILFYPKSGCKENVFAQITHAVMLILELHTFWGYITLEIFNSKVELLHFAGFDFFVAIAIILYWIIIKRKKVQGFSMPYHMWTVAGLLFLAAAFIGVWRYGLKLNLFAYCSADSANHLAWVEAIATSAGVPEGLEGRYFLHINEALLFKCVAGWVQPMSYYRIFLLAELFFFFLSGAVFYTLIEKYMDTSKNIGIGILFVFLYVFGYPLNNLLYGYEYLGAAVSTAIHIEYLLERLMKRKNRCWDILITVAIASFAMYHGYSLLFVCILAGMAICYIVYYLKHLNVFKAALILVCGILVLFNIGLVYAYWKQMVNKLTTEAIMYRDLWSNILWIGPFILIGIKECIVKKNKNITFGMFLGVTGTWGLFLIYMWNQNVSSYYFYKFNFLLWFFCLYIAYIGAVTLSKKHIKSMAVYLTAIILLITCSNIFNNKDKKILNENYMDIYIVNWRILSQRQANIDEKWQELFYAVAQKVAETGTLVPYIGTWEDYLAEYYYCLTNQSSIEIRRKLYWEVVYNFWYAEEELNNMLQKYIFEPYNPLYIMVERNSDAYWYGIGYYSTLEVVYENEYGFIYMR